MPPIDVNQLGAMMARYIDDPVAFVREILHVEPSEWQTQTLEALAGKGRVAVRAGHGVGKTALESWSVLWFMFTRPYCRVPATAPTARQLNDVLWAEIGKWIAGAPILQKYFEWQKTRIIAREAPERWYATARTATKPENLAGFHEEHILFIIDEASGVADEIFEVVEGALTTWDAKLLLCGNPTRTSGTFYDAFHKDRDLYWTRKVSCLELPPERVSPDYAARLIKKYGADSDVVRVRVHGDFPKAEPDQFIPLELVEAATLVDVSEPTENGVTAASGTAESMSGRRLVGPLEVGADISRYGDDETVIYVRIGTHVFPPHTYRNISTVETANRIIQHTREYMDKYYRNTVAIKVDDTGVGGGVTDNLVAAVPKLKGDWSIIPCNFGGAGDEDCDDAATVMLKHVRDLLQAGELHLPNDDDTIAQLTTRKYSVTAKGKLKIESKKEYKARTGLSPDRADALVLCLKPAIAVKVATNIVTPKKASPVRGLRNKKF